MRGELLYPLESVQCYVSEKLQVFPMIEGKPNPNLYSYVWLLSSEWVNRISESDDRLVSYLINNLEDSWD